jgi:hypothetical protein
MSGAKYLLFGFIALLLVNSLQEFGGHTQICDIQSQLATIFHTHRAEVNTFHCLQCLPPKTICLIFT